MKTAPNASRAKEPDMKESACVEPFKQRLSRQGIGLLRDRTTTLQINVGLLCNQVCRHCHLDAGPFRTENMGAETAEAVIDYARRAGFEAIDITGGAPELNPHMERLVTQLSATTSKIILRSNLSVLNDGKRDRLMALLVSHKVALVASLPAVNASQTDSQRGGGVFQKSIDALRKLNALGYGQNGTGLELNLVSNPTGAFLSPD